MIQYITAARVANSLRIKRSAYKDVSFLIVEGVTDKRLYQKFVCGQYCSVEIGQNKDNVIEAVRILNSSETPGIAGIVDSDFSHILPDSRLNQANLYTTDTHDAETLMVKSQALYSVLMEFGDMESMLQFKERTGNDIREAILRAGKIIGILRLYSIKNNLNLNFSRLNYQHFMNMETMEVDLDKLIEESLRESEAVSVDKDTVIRGIAALENEGYDPWDLCRGHDISEILALGLRHSFGTEHARNLYSNDVEEALRLSYLYFNETKLYQGLKGWEECNSPYRIVDETCSLEEVI